MVLITTGWKGFSMHQRFYSILAPLFALILSTLLQSAEKELPLNHTPSPGEYQSPDQTAANMKLPDGFQVQVFAGEPDVYQPIGYCFDARGRLWVVENYSYPDWAKEGRDRVVIFTDEDGDGRFDERKLFWDKGNFATGIQIGYGGVWIGSPPHLLFIPDRNGDDVPDGDPEKLLDGWAHDDTHETLNSFVWGPDQWLYGCQGASLRAIQSRQAGFVGRGTDSPQRLHLALPPDAARVRGLCRRR